MIKERNDQFAVSCEEALKECQERQRLFFEHVPAAVAMFDRDMRYVYASKRWLIDYRLEERDIIGRSHYEIFPEISEHLKEIHRRTLAGQVHRGEEDSFLRADGTVDWVQWESVPWREAGGRIGGIIIFSIVVTRCRRAEDALNAALDRLHLALSGMSFGTLLVTEDGRVEFANQAFCSLFNLKECPEELKGLTSDEIIRISNSFHKDPGAALARVREIVRQGKQVTDEEIPMKGGRTFMRDFIPLHRGKQKYGRLWIHRDITDKKRAADAMRKSLEGTIKAISAIVEIRDPYTAGQQARVARLSVAIAAEMGFSENRLYGIRIAASLYDIGKIYVPSEILSKPAPLTMVEMELIKMHPRASYDILKQIDFPWPVAEIALQHQERCDGSGYPWGLTGDAILPEARIIAVANTAEAMLAQRPYRVAWGVNVVLDTLRKGRGVTYDPAVVDIAVSLLQKRQQDAKVPAHA